MAFGNINDTGVCLSRQCIIFLIQCEWSTVFIELDDDEEEKC